MQIHVTDVSLRDGLQDLNVILSPAIKVNFARELVAAGLPRIELAAFVHPGKVPQMADAEEVVTNTRGLHARRVALALNTRGVQRAAASGVEEVAIVTSASQAHSSANSGQSVEAALAGFATVVTEYPQMNFSAGVSTAFVCPFEGQVSSARVAQIARQLADLGINHIGLADTIGTATPEQVVTTFHDVMAAVPDVTYSLHLHNARGQVRETVAAAIESGVMHFDAALAGYGGCPYAPGAHGNLALEDLVDQLHDTGHETGIDSERIYQLAADFRYAVAEGTPLPRTFPPAG